MGMINSKDYASKKRIDECTSNSSLSNLRYVITEKPKWKVFKKKEIVPLPRGVCKGGCPCGNDGPCKQKVTPKGVTIHYPQTKKKRYTFKTKVPVSKAAKHILSTPRTAQNVKLIRPKKMYTWRLDHIKYKTPFNNTPVPKLVNPTPAPPAEPTKKPGGPKKE